MKILFIIAIVLQVIYTAVTVKSPDSIHKTDLIVVKITIIIMLTVLVTMV